MVGRGKHILFFTAYPPADHRAGGGDLGAWETIHHLAKRGHRLDVFLTKTDVPLENIPNVTFHIITKRNLLLTPVAWLACSAKWRDVDIVHSFVYETFLVALVFGFLTRAKVFHEVHTPKLEHVTILKMIKHYFTHQRPGGRFIIDRWASRVSHGIFCSSKYNKRMIAETYDVPEDRVHIVCPGVEPIKTSGKRKSGLVVSLGRLDRVKGIDTILQAFKNVLKNHPANLKIAGQGPLEEELKQLCGQENIRNVTFLGRISDEEKNHLFGTGTVFVIASRDEGLPMVVAEAMMAGIPVVSTNVGGLPEIVEHNVTGLLVPPDNPEALAKAILKVLKDDDLCKRLTKNARAWVEANLSWALRAEQIETTYGM